VRFLAVPNWSLQASDSLSGKSAEQLLAEARLAVTGLGVRIHFWSYDPDHGRAVTAFSGVAGQMEAAVIAIAERILPEVDLGAHEGVHPRVGVLDVCPFVSLLPIDSSHQDQKEEIDRLVRISRTLAAEFSAKFKIPTRLYEYAAHPGSPSSLPVLRSPKATLPPPTNGSEFEGSASHLKNGVSIFGVRDFLIAANIDLDTIDPLPSIQIARAIREGREAGDSRFLGVRALGFELPSVRKTQVSMNLTQPNHSSFDTVYGFVETYCQKIEVPIHRTELIGVIRQSDLAKSTLLQIDPAQVVD